MNKPLLDARSLSLLAATSLTVMANATIAPALPGIRDAFHDTPGIVTLVGLVMTLPSLAVILTAGLWGVFIDRFGRRPAMIAGVALFGFSGASGAIAVSLEQLFIGRALLGVAVGGTMTVTTALAIDLFSGAERERFTGYQGAAMSLGGIVFLLAGGALSEWSWRGAFLVYLVALLILVPVVLFIRDVPKAVMPAGSAPSRMPWAFLVFQCSIAIVVMIVFYLIPVKLAFLLRDMGVDRPILAGVAVAAGTLSGVVSSLTYGRVRRSLSAAMIYVVAFSIMAVGLFLIGTATSYWQIIAGTAVQGFGIGFVMPNGMVWLMSRVPADMRGRASGFVTMAVYMGQFLSPLVAGPTTALVGLPLTYVAAAGVMTAMAGWMAVIVMRGARPRTSSEGRL